MKPILRTALVLVAALVVAAAVPIVRHAWAASCPASAGCNNFSTFWATFTYLVTGGTTARSDADRQVDEGMNVFDAGVDCTGGSDSTTAFQNAVNAMPDGGTLWFPVGCRMKLSSTITIRSRANVAFRSTSPGGVGSCNGKVPQILWTASGGTVFDFEYVDVPWIDGLSFLVSGASAYANTFLNYDRSGSNPHHKTGTAGRIYNSCFSNASNTTSDFAAIYIAPTTGDNEEDFIVDNISVSCSISRVCIAVTRRVYRKFIDNDDFCYCEFCQRRCRQSYFSELSRVFLADHYSVSKERDDDCAYDGAVHHAEQCYNSYRAELRLRHPCR